MGQFFLSLLSLSILSQINPIDHREVTKRCFLGGDLRATIRSRTCPHLAGLWACREVKKPYLQLWFRAQEARSELCQHCFCHLHHCLNLTKLENGQKTRTARNPHIFSPCLPIKIAKGGLKMASTSLVPVRYPMNILNWRNPFRT